jgi:hypothetical protein
MKGFASGAGMRRRIPAGLRRVVAQATDVDPDRRQRDISNLLVDLYLRRGRRVGLLPRARRLVIPEKLRAAGSKLAMIAVILGAAVTLVFMGRGIWGPRDDAGSHLSRRDSSPAAVRSSAGPEPAPVPRETPATAHVPSSVPHEADATARPAPAPPPAPQPARDAASAMPSTPPPEVPIARPSPPPPTPVIAAPATSDLKGGRPRAPEAPAPRAVVPDAAGATAPRPTPTEAARPEPPLSAPARDAEDPGAIIDWLLKEGAAQRRAP